MKRREVLQLGSGLAALGILPVGLAGPAAAQATMVLKASDVHPAGYARMEKAGIVVTKIADKTPFQTAVKPVWDKYGDKWPALIKRIQDTK